MKQKNNKVLQFPTRIEVNEKNKRNKIKINWVILFSALSVLIAGVSIISNFIIDKKSEKQLKPIVNLSIEYAYSMEEVDGNIIIDENKKYIQKVSVNVNDGKVEHMDIVIEPFFNIMYYNQSKQTLLKQILPIYHMENNFQYTPFEVERQNIKTGNIVNLVFNENTINTLSDMLDMFSDSEKIVYNRSFLELFDDSIIASIDFEFYITINYTDIYQNNYTDIYLCETGYTKFSGYLSDFMFTDSTDLRESDAEYNAECAVAYSALKLQNLDNAEFNARSSQILKEDVIYKEFHNFYSKIYNNPDLIMYIPNFERNLEVLISDGYKEGQLMFILDRNDSEWKTFDK